MQATRDMERCLSDLTAYGMARASAEVWWGKDPTSEKYINITDLSKLKQIINPKPNYKLNNIAWGGDRKAHKTHLKFNLEAKVNHISRTGKHVYRCF